MWTEKDNSLQRVFRFRNFVEAWAFMTEVAFHAERLGHHPNWSNVYNSVEIKLNTHDAGNIVTAKDYELAAAIDNVYKKFER
jgi:4a-hydroxytetrahydrobiopterin dehydratase